MKLSDAKKKFNANWIAFAFTNNAKEEGRVLLADKERRRLHQKLRSRKRLPANLYITYAGPKLPKDFSIILISVQ